MAENRNFTVYAAYIVTSLLGFVLGRFLQYRPMRYVFLFYLLGIFVFTGALPYLVEKIGKHEKGYLWNTILKFIFPLLSLVGAILVVAILIKVGW